MNEERPLGWDDEISNDGGSFDTVPPGDYPFEIVELKRGQYQPKPGGSGKLPPCPKAEIKVRVYAPSGDKVDIDHNLYLHSRCEGMLCAFFVAIGQRKHGEPLRPNWGQVVGSRGYCKVSIRDWTGKDGNKYQSNDIKSFLDPAKFADKATNVPPAPEVPFEVPGEGGF
jgi:hypothetical protein